MKFTTLQEYIQAHVSVCGDCFKAKSLQKKCVRGVTEGYRAFLKTQLQEIEKVKQ